MIKREISDSIMNGLEKIRVIDSHEHLKPECHRISADVDVLDLFPKYIYSDLMAAGMSKDDYRYYKDKKLPLEIRWNLFEPYLKYIRNTSYSRTAFIAVKKFYGFDDINSKTYIPISEAMCKANTEGIYNRILIDTCKIKTCLTQIESTDMGDSIFTPVMPVDFDLTTWDTLVNLKLHKNFAGWPARYLHKSTINTLDDLIDSIEYYIAQVRKEGTVGLKMESSNYSQPDRGKAIESFNQLRDGLVEQLYDNNSLKDYVMDAIITLAEKYNLTIAIHTDFQEYFGRIDPLHMIPMLTRHPKVRFDVHLLGYPWIRETLMLGKGFPNVWVNFGWSHIISESGGLSAMIEAMDFLPSNKVIAFGGDFNGYEIEGVYSHLLMAKQNMAEAFAEKIIRNQLTETRALEIANMWLYRNAVDLYSLLG